MVFNKHTTRNSVSLSDFDEDHIDNGNDDNDEHGKTKRVNGGNGLLPRTNGWELKCG